jgi:8-oxo-dGTP pyrophosphatase MutT (NUDIX family)
MSTSVIFPTSSKLKVILSNRSHTVAGNVRNYKCSTRTSPPKDDKFKHFRSSRTRAARCARSKSGNEESKPPRKSRCGACIISQCGKKCLLVKQKEAQKWSFPKGSKEKYETKEECMKRELLEETGVSLGGYEYDTLECVKRYKYYIFILRLKEKEDSMVLKPLDKHEIEMAKWIPLSDLAQKDMLPDTPDTAEPALYKMNYVTKSILDKNSYISHLLTGVPYVPKKSKQNCAGSSESMYSESTTPESTTPESMSPTPSSSTSRNPSPAEPRS